jgi:hypothetical protein
VAGLGAVAAVPAVDPADPAVVPAVDPASAGRAVAAAGFPVSIPTSILRMELIISTSWVGAALASC